MKTSILAFIILVQSFCVSRAQTINCGDALLQLQGYAAQVNAIYQTEYRSVIPYQRCPGCCDAWGRYYPPQVVQNCRYQMLMMLNNWYAQQASYVNYWYAQIVRGCSTQPPVEIKKIATVPKGADEAPEIEEDEITAGIDEDKAVKITIPKTPAGFRPKK